MIVFNYISALFTFKYKIIFNKKHIFNKHVFIKGSHFIGIFIERLKFHNLISNTNNERKSLK